MGAALCPHIADKGWADFRGRKVRERGRGERWSESTKVVADESLQRRRGRGEVEGKDTFQPLTSVIRLSRAGKKIAGSILVVA